MNIIHVGLGPAGREWLQALRGRRDVQSIACVDGDETALAWARAHVTEPGKCGTRLEDALTGAKADAAVIASPPLRRASDAVLALEAGLAVIVEAPIATSEHGGSSAIERESTPIKREMVLSVARTVTESSWESGPSPGSVTTSTAPASIAA